METKDFEGVARLFGLLRELGTEARGRMVLQFSGYDHVPEEIYEIEEIREYVSEMFHRWPEMFYYLTQEIIIYKIILACILDIETAFVGEKKKGFDALIFGNEPMTPVQVAMFMSPAIKTAIETNLRAYGKEINEDTDIMEEIILNLVDLNRGVQSNMEEMAEAARSNLDETYQEASKQVWQVFLDNLKNFKIIPEHKLSAFIRKNHSFVLQVKDKNWLTLNLLTQKKFTNVFLVKDEAAGSICPDCGSTIVAVYKKNLFSVIKNPVFLPSFENYKTEHIIPLSERFWEELPVPVNPQVDKWACPHCLTVHSFKDDGKYD